MSNLDELAAEAVHVRRAQQKPWELARLGDLIRLHGCESAIEVGTCYGGTAWFLKQLGLQLEVVDVVMQSPHWQGVTYYLGDSVKRAKDMRDADFVLLDGDHVYEGVHRDWQTFRGKVKKGGLLAFHDIVDHSSWHDRVQVDRLWREVKESRVERTMEIVEGGEPWGGFGVVFL